MKNQYKPPIQTAFGGYFARNLRRFCLEQNLTQEEAADRCQCSARGFGNLCRGVSLPTIQTLENPRLRQSLPGCLPADHPDPGECLQVLPVHPGRPPPAAALPPRLIPPPAAPKRAAFFVSCRQ